MARLIHTISGSGAGGRALILTAIQNFSTNNRVSIAAATPNPVSISNNTFTQTRAQAAPRRVTSIANGSTHGSADAADDNNDVEELVRQTTPILPRRKSKVAHTTYRIKLPQWLSNRVWEINIAQRQNGWDHKLRTYNVVSGDSPLFIACRRGDVEAVRQLFSSGQASPFDIDEHGQTALFVSNQDVRLILYVNSEYSMLLGA